MSEIDVEEDTMHQAWCIAPTEACTFVAVAVFASKRDAQAFLAVLRKRRKRSSAYDDLVILPARATVLAANTFDVTEGRRALEEVGS